MAFSCLNIHSNAFNKIPWTKFATTFRSIFLNYEMKEVRFYLNIFNVIYLSPTKYKKIS